VTAPVVTVTRAHADALLDRQPCPTCGGKAALWVFCCTDGYATPRSTWLPMAKPIEMVFPGGEWSKAVPPGTRIDVAVPCEWCDNCEPFYCAPCDGTGLVVVGSVVVGRGAVVRPHPSAADRSPAPACIVLYYEHGPTLRYVPLRIGPVVDLRHELAFATWEPGMVAHPVSEPERA
jgi:hypothetical protein